MNFGFVSTRFSGTDGVSLESMKWADVFSAAGHRCFWFSGLSDRPEEISQVVPLAHFEHPEIQSISERLWNSSVGSEALVTKIGVCADLLHEELERFCDAFAIDVLVPQNSLTIPMNFPLGVALANLIEQHEIRVLAHHHDFFWERSRFDHCLLPDELERFFPPILPSIAHAVINTQAEKDLRSRKALSSTVIPNVMPFETDPPTGRCVGDVRNILGFAKEDILFLQPTRVVPRKGIELTIELIERLGDPRVKLVISHSAGDEGFEYLTTLRERANESGIELSLVADQVEHSLNRTNLEEPDHVTLAEIYSIADLVTYPSLYEGFGNALLEAVYFRRPVLVNRYSVYRDDIEPCGFDFLTIDGSITDETVAATRALLDDPVESRQATEENFRIARKHFGYEALQAALAEALNPLEIRL